MKPRPKFCEQCGRELPLEGKFCPGCGDLIESPAVPSIEEVPPAYIPKPPYTGGNAANAQPTTPPVLPNQPFPPQQTTKAPFGVGAGYKPGAPVTTPFPTPTPFAGKTPYAGAKIVREKRMGGGIPTFLGGLAFLGYPVYAVINKITPSFIVPIVGLIALVIGIFMLRVRNWKTFALAFLGSMTLAAYSGYTMYQLIQITQSATEDIPLLRQSGMIFTVIGCVLILFGFSRAFNSLFRR
ncbi:MAG: hypothetical protein DDT42_01315 [candidate division WS2 bacterium]|uniref:Zinc-ribbon domain-containing protein n=1 Tax=Psychracetigena formicireducens TaxID=2986056 RepID=A0A9E2BI26_PSYF1|nr:hypothetical protein [Candidatus Psychracetigena formicireducens]MBT9145444.1 hypothetical protein [Candidatus Psychracetigena formicireducens]